MTYEEKLKESGINSKKASIYKLLKIKSVLKATGMGPDAEAIEIPYFDINAKKLNFSRYRLLKSNKGPFAPLEFKYYQPKGSESHVYLPPSIKWASVSKNASENIIITEGEFKAIATSEAGYNCIGLGGVSTFQSKKKGIVLLSPLDRFVWKGRKVYIIYDSDLLTNIEVRKAQHRLAQLLQDRGALVYIGFVSDFDSNSKMGLDDVIVKYGNAVVDNIIDGAQPFSVYDEIERLNEEILYNVTKDKVYFYNQDTYVSVAAFKNYMANRSINKIVYNKKQNDFITKRVKLGDEWLDSPLRLTVFDDKFRPDINMRFFEENGQLYYNTFSGYDIKPLVDIKNIEKRNSIKLFMQLLDFIFKNDTKENLNWFLHWMAEGLRSPHKKLHTAVIVWSEMEGNGKSTIGLLLSKLYGKYSSNITSTTLRSPYNDFLRNKLFITSDELSGEDVDNIRETKKYMDQLKNLITQDDVTINQKYVVTYQIKDYSKYFFTSNNINMVSLSEISRRFFVVHAPEEKMPKEFYKELYDVCFSQQGLQEIMTYLLNFEVDKVIVLNSEAPVTVAKQEIIKNSRTTKEQWFIDLQEAAAATETMEDSGFAVGQIVPEVITLSDLTDAASDVFDKKQYMCNMRRLLSRYKIPLHNKKIKTKRKQGNKETIIILANVKKWRGCNESTIIKYINNWRNYHYEV